MELSHHTTLEQLDSLPADLRQRLAALWIESVEDYLGLLGALKAASAATAWLPSPVATVTRDGALTLLPPELGRQLARGRRGGELGCAVRPEVLALYRAQRRLGSRREGQPLGLTADGLPPAVRLLEQPGPVRDQGNRGTCVAFATVALREFLDPWQTALSEQFLYWACKQLDGFPEAGTTLHTAMGALNQYGCCRAATWPYQPQPVPGNESQNPPPPAAVPEATRFRLSDCRPVEPGLVAHYKRVLAGHGGARPMPVVLGVLVFNSWLLSPATHQSGKITLPLPDEDPVGGHAMCVVGYVDDPAVPGGGYFIVRNSWGSQWAAHSPEAPGHALMPYAYVEACAMEAFSGPARPSAAESAALDPEWAGFVRTLERPTRDQSAPHGHGELLKEGTAVVLNPLAPEEVMRDTPKHRRDFIALDHAWSCTTRQKVWFPAVNTLPADLLETFDAARANRDRFLSAIAENLRRAAGTPFPKLHVSRWAVFVPYEWEPKISAVEPVADLTAELVSALQPHSGVPVKAPEPDARPHHVPGPYLPWPEEWTRLLREINKLQVFRLGGMAGSCVVVAAFVTPLRFRHHAPPQPALVSQELLDAIRQVYRAWAVGPGGCASEAVFFTVAVAGTLPAHLHNPASGQHWEMLVAFRPDGTWSVPPLRQEIERLSLRDFLDRLKPETFEQRLSCLRKALDDQLDNYQGNVSESRLSDVTRYRQSQVREAFYLLQSSHPDRYLIDDKAVPGKLVMKRPGSGDKPRVLAPSSIRKALRRHALGVLTLVVGAGFTSGTTWLKEHLGLPTWLSFVVGILIAYFGQVVNKAINQRADKGKD